MDLNLPSLLIEKFIKTYSSLLRMDQQLTELELTFLEEYEAALLLLQYEKTKAALILLSEIACSLTEDD